MTRKMWAVLATIAAVLLIACTPTEEQDEESQPVRDRTFTLHWYSDQPYTAKWVVSAEPGAPPLRGLNPSGEEWSAGQEFKKKLVVGQTPLVITVIVVMSTKFDVNAWVKITEDGKELTYQKADAGTRQAIVVYHYKPIKPAK